ncbi:MAG: hypothetical protein ACLSA2_10145 [Candidatus Gastranaerophilaceae bacterium]
MKRLPLILKLKVIADAGTKFNLLTVDVINKMKEGDGKLSDIL